MKKIIFVFCAFIPTLTFARIGTDQGNGGDAVLMDGKYYLLDLVEAGSEIQPYIDMNIQPRADFLKRTERAMPAGFPHELIARKLTEIYQVNVMLSHVLLKSIEAYQWKIVNSSLLDIYDENTNLDIPRKHLYQLAVRKDSSVLVDRNLWEKLDSGNKTALVFHEILYALGEPIGTGRFVAPGYPDQYQSSRLAREINGYLFSDLPRQGNEGLSRFTSYYKITNEYFFTDFTGVSDQGNSLLANPFIQIDMNAKWVSHRDGKTSIPLSTSYPSQDSENLMKDACSFALKEQQPIRILFYEGSGLYISLSVFQTFSGPRKYLWTDHKKGIRFTLLDLSFKNEKKCLETLKEVIGPKIEEIKRKYN